MRRYLPEALFFAPALLTLLILRVGAFGELPEFVFVVLIVSLSMPYGTIASTLVIPVLAFGLKQRGASFAAPILGSALAIGSLILYLAFLNLQSSLKTPEFYWDALWIIPIVSIALFITARIRANPRAAFAYVAGAVLLATEYLAVPSMSAR